MRIGKPILLWLAPDLFSNPDCKTRKQISFQIVYLLGHFAAVETDREEAGDTVRLHIQKPMGCQSRWWITTPTTPQQVWSFRRNHFVFLSIAIVTDSFLYYSFFLFSLYHTLTQTIVFLSFFFFSLSLPLSLSLSITHTHTLFIIIFFCFQNESLGLTRSRKSGRRERLWSIDDVTQHVYDSISNRNSLYS